MKLAARLAWEYRLSWLAMWILTGASSLVLIISTHASRANDILSHELDQPTINLDLYISLLATFLVVQTIAALCLESQAKDLAVIKTCGASQRSVRRTLLAEIVVVTLAGYGLGLLISLFTREPYVHLSVKYLTEATTRNFGPDLMAHVNALLLLLGAVILGSLKTVFRVSRQNVVSALHGEGENDRKHRNIARILSTIGAGIVIVLSFGLVVASSLIVNLLNQRLGGGDPEQQSIITSAQGSLILFPPMLVVMACMVLVTTHAERLYPWMLSSIVRKLPVHVPGTIQVGLSLAKYNAAKYYGSITPLVIFVLTVIMIFSTIAGATPALGTLYAQHNIDIKTLGGTNYPVVALLIGPALFIAFVGALCNIMMSGRGRIYVTKLTAILGIKTRGQYLQGIMEMIGYVVIAAIIGLIVMLVCGVMTMVSGTNVSGVRQPFIVSWAWYALSVIVIFVIVTIPAISAVRHSKSIPNKSALESFGQ